VRHEKRHWPLSSVGKSRETLVMMDELELDYPRIGVERQRV
jgi:hypothetical protein